MPAKGESHDWDAMFADLDETQQQQHQQQQQGVVHGQDAGEGVGIATPGQRDDLIEKDGAATVGSKTAEDPEKDDPIVRNLTGMGYSRVDAVAALEKHDYNLARVSLVNFKQV